MAAARQKQLELSGTKEGGDDDDDDAEMLTREAPSEELEAPADDERPPRSARFDQRDEQKSSRSRSRGRTPSELLARKQQLISGQQQLHTQKQNQKQDQNGAQKKGADFVSERAESAESKLESLSVLLKSHQAEEADELQGAGRAAAISQSLKSIDDVYILLAKKEKDLQLAAELGKVLLERNDELSKANERMAEEYSHKLELLEQEKHRLKRKLDLLDGEYENRLIEAQTDCNVLKNKLEQEQRASKQAEKEKSKLIDDLVQQNQRLTSELAEATKSEELLASQLEQLNERLQSRSSNRSDQAAQVEALEDELQVLNRRKQDLERRLKLAQNEKANLVAAVDETGDKVLILEDLLNEKELKIGELAIEISELRDSSSWLSSQLESMISLNERLAACDPEHDHGARDLRRLSERERAHLVEQLKELRLKRESRIKANKMILESAAERRRRSLETGDGARGSRHHKGRRRRRQQQRQLKTWRRPGSGHDHREHDQYSSGPEEPEELDEEGAEVGRRDLMREVFAILSELHNELVQRRERLAHVAQANTSAGQFSSMGGSTRLTAASNAPDDSGLGSADETQAQAPAQRDANQSEGPSDGDDEDELSRWRQLVASLRRLLEELPCSSCHLMIGERADYEQLQRLHARLCDEIRLKNQELLKFNAQNIEQKRELGALEERVRLLEADLEACDKPQDEIVRLAWKARDEAVGRKNSAEIQLAKTRIENMQVSSQLMEVVQQKGELSQRLAQFEDDIHHMMQSSVRARFSWEEHAEQTRRLADMRAQRESAAATGIQQLLSLSSAVLLSPTKRKANANGASRGQHKPAEVAADTAQADSLQEPANASRLLSNFRSAGLNLKFWQRAGAAQPADRAAVE